MYFNVSRENILRMFRNEHRERLNAAGKGQLDSLADMLDIADAALNAVLDIINEETQVALDSFQQGGGDSRDARRRQGPLHDDLLQGSGDFDVEDRELRG
jgi:hypothetical protein